ALSRISPERLWEGLAKQWLSRRAEHRSARPSRLRHEAGLGERPPTPCELARVPAVEARDGDALARRVDEPAVAEEDPHVADLRRLRARAAVAEEDHVSGLELCERDAVRPRDLAAH